MTQALLAVTGVSVQYSGLRAITDVSFSVEEGELLALIGPNGAGKTTLLNVLAGEVKPTAGTVTYAGKPTGRLAPYQVVRRGLARTFQAAEPFQHLTVRENVMIGLAPQAGVGLLASLAGFGRQTIAAGRLRQSADEHLAAVGLGNCADQSAATLTAGQRRLLSIARALATGAQTLVLDEPGAGLNEKEKSALAEVILALSKSRKTIIFVDHDMPLVSRVARRILVLDRGHLIADGQPDEVRANPRVIDAYLGVRQPASVTRIDTVASAAPGSEERLLRVDNVQVNYAGLVALDGVSLDVNRGEIVTLVGANGAGKSTLLRTIARVERGRASSIAFAGDDLLKVGAERAVSLGISLVPEGRALFGSLTVAENLAAGRYARRRAQGFRHVLWRSAEEKVAFEQRLAVVYALFPVLRERETQLAGTLSGGQGQMLAIGRAIMGDPKLLMLDEPSLGLAPQVVEEIFACIERLRQQGVTILLVEQNIGAALAIADRGYVLANGRIVAEGAGRTLMNDARIAEAYLGTHTLEEHETSLRPPLAAAGFGR